MKGLAHMPARRLGLAVIALAAGLACGEHRPAAAPPSGDPDVRRTERDAPTRHRSTPPGYGHEIVRSRCADSPEQTSPDCPDRRATE